MKKAIYKWTRGLFRIIIIYMTSKISTENFLETSEALTVMSDTICNGGSLVTYCEENGYVYSMIINWIYEDVERQKVYERALEARGEYAKQKILAELHLMSYADVKELFREDGRLKPVSEWSDDLAKTIESIEVADARYDRDGNETSPEVTKIKRVGKLKAIEMMMKNMAMLIDRKEVTGILTLEDLVGGSMDSESEDLKEDSDGEARSGTEEVVETDKASAEEDRTEAERV